MATMTTRIKERVIMGLQFGAQIAPSVVLARIAEVLDEVYERSEVARFDLTPISEVEDTDEYDLPALEEAPAGSRIVRVLSVCRVTRGDPDNQYPGTRETSMTPAIGALWYSITTDRYYEGVADDAAPQPFVDTDFWQENSMGILSRNYLDSQAFNVDAGIGEDGTAPTSSVLTLANVSPATATDSLIVRIAAAFPTEDYVPAVYTRDFEEAAACRTMQLFCSEVGKAWSDLNRAALEEKNYKTAISRLRMKSLQRGTGRSTACQARYSFI